jgi:hypothetical protein
MNLTCEVCRGALPDGCEIREGHTALCAEVIRADRDEVLRALARHDGRGWCAVCGFVNGDCNAKTPDCIGARARREFPTLVPKP